MYSLSLISMTVLFLREGVNKVAQYNRTMVKIVISTGVKSWIDKTDMPVEWNGKKVLRWHSRGSSQLLRTGSNGNRLYL